MFRAIGEKPETLDNGKKGIAPFQAFAISAASRVGTGNIACGYSDCFRWTWRSF